MISLQQGHQIIMMIQNYYKKCFQITRLNNIQYLISKMKRQDTKLRISNNKNRINYTHHKAKKK